MNIHARILSGHVVVFLWYSQLWCYICNSEYADQYSLILNVIRKIDWQNVSLMSSHHFHWLFDSTTSANDSGGRGNNWVHNNIHVTVNQFYCSSLYLCKSVSSVSTIACNFNVCACSLCASWCYSVSLGSRHPEGTDEGDRRCHLLQHPSLSDPIPAFVHAIQNPYLPMEWGKSCHFVFHSLSVLCIGLQLCLTTLISIVA